MIRSVLYSIASLLLIASAVCGQDSKNKEYRTVTWKEGGCIAESKTYHEADKFLEENPPVPIPCDSVVVDDQKYRLIYDEAVILAITPVRLDDYLAIHIQVLNKGKKRILIDPSQVELSPR